MLAIMKQYLSWLWQTVYCYGHILRRALEFEVEGQRKAKMTWKKLVEGNYMDVLTREDEPC